jgi:carbamoyl-phosphate synthase large subunit
MNSHIKILLPSGGNCANIIEHLLKVEEIKFSFVVCDIAPMERIPDSTIFFICPRTESSDYRSFIAGLCSDYEIDIIIPGTSMDVKFYAANRNSFEHTGIKILISNDRAIKTSLNKELCFSFLKEKGIDVPDYYLVKNIEEYRQAVKALGFPSRKVCMKPSEYPDGSGKGFRIIDDSNLVFKNMFYELPSKMYTVSNSAVVESMEKFPDFPPMLLMEYLPDREYSVYCFCSDGKAEYIVPNLKLGLVETNTKVAVVEENIEIIEQSKKICELFGFEHNINIQFKYSEGGIPKVVEINPRVAGTILLPVHAGVDLLLFSIKKALNMNYSRNAEIKYGTKIERVLTEIFA